MPRRLHRLLLTVALLIGTARITAADPPARPLAAQLRRPVALVTPDNGRHFLVANRDSGTISRVDIPARRVTAEFRIGSRLGDLALSPDGRHVLVVDSGRRQLVVCRLENGRPIPSIRWQAGHSPAIPPD